MAFTFELDANWTPYGRQFAQDTIVTNLTKRSVEALRSQQKRLYVWDDTLKGFGVRVEPTGRKSFLCRYRVGTIRRQYQLGSFGTITVEEARSEARRILSSSVLGDDLAGKRYEARRAFSFAELVEKFAEEHHSKLKPASRTNYEGSLIKHAVPVLGRTPADAVTTAQLTSSPSLMRPACPPGVSVGE